MTATPREPHLLESTKSQEAKYGRGAADRLWHDWPDVSWIPTNVSDAWARAAIERLGELIREQPALVKASIEGSERGAESLSARPFQGILESLQNADDLEATELRVALRKVAGRRELLIVHNGLPVQLSHVGAMVLPWVSTKSDDPEAAGRFGIGQKTLTSLGGPIGVHCHPYHFTMTPSGPTLCTPAQSIEDIYDKDQRETLLVVPLYDSVERDALSKYVQGLRPESLLFLRSVHRLVFADLAPGGSHIDHRLDTRKRREISLQVDDDELPCELRVLRDPVERRRYIRYSVQLPLAKGEHRYHKATGGTATLGIGVLASGAGTGQLYDRLPMPISLPFPLSLNAPFDPDTARSMLLQREWNSRRLGDLGRLLVGVALHCFSEDPRVGWRTVPLSSEQSLTGDWLETEIQERIVEAVQEAISKRLQLPIDGELRSLQDIVYEDAALDGLLYSGDQEYLRPDKHFLEAAHRDSSGRWRLVLDDLAITPVVSVTDALSILDQDDEQLGPREPSWYVSMARAAIDADALTQLLWKRSILLADGGRIEPPGGDDPRSLVCTADPYSLATKLGVALLIHPCYLSESKDAQRVASALKEAGVLLENCDSGEAVLDVISRDSEGNTIGRVRLEDNQLLSLRDAFERCDDEKQRRIGPQIGKNIELRTVDFSRSGQPDKGWNSPHDAYLPATIDREPDSFARAAAKTPRISWLDPDYARLLKRSGGRRELGAQRFLTRLGASIFPRLTRPHNEAAVYRGDSRPASSIHGLARPELQMREIRALPNSRTHLLRDHWSPDLDAAISDIAKDANSKRRRRRGLALLGVLVRGWDRHFEEYRHSLAVYASYSLNDPQEVISTWLARASSNPWLPSSTGALRAPEMLLLPTDANRVYRSDKGAFLCRVEEHILRSPALDALQLRRGPSVSDLISKLSELAAGDLNTGVESEVKTIYRLLAVACSQDKRSRSIDDMAVSEFRRRFTAGNRGRGLIFVDGLWYSPGEVFRGARIFGKFRPFVPNNPMLDPLWDLLGIPNPTVNDGFAVLREIGKQPLEPSDQAVVLDSMRFLASKLPTMATQAKAQLKRLPLWGGDDWIVSRPIYAIEDDDLAEGSSGQLPVWRSGFSGLTELGVLLDALGVVYVPADAFSSTSTTAGDLVLGNDHRRQFSLAVAHLRDELARGDSGLYHSASVDWKSLEAANVIVDDELTLAARIDGRRVQVNAAAHLQRTPLTLIVASSDDLGNPETGGRAIASVFGGDRQKVAWAWSAMWAKAADGSAPQGIVLSGTDHEDLSADRLIELKNQALRRMAKSPRGTRNGGSSTGQTPEVKIRELKQLSELEPTEGTIVNAGQSRKGVILPTPSQRKGKDQVSPSSESGGRRHGTGQTRTVLPPVDDREKLALDAVQRALQLGDQQIIDLRSAHGIGADAMDELRQLFEIKMWSGKDFPGEVTLTRAEADAAQNDPDFFLALVCGLEEDVGDLRVRFVFDPLQRLAVRIRGEVTLSGVNEVEALEYTFQKMSPDE